MCTAASEAQQRNASEPVGPVAAALRRLALIILNHILSGFHKPPRAVVQARLLPAAQVVACSGRKGAPTRVQEGQDQASKEVWETTPKVQAASRPLGGAVVRGRRPPAPAGPGLEMHLSQHSSVSLLTVCCSCALACSCAINCCSWGEACCFASGEAMAMRDAKLCT